MSNGQQSPQEEIDHLHGEIDRLARYLLREHPDEAGRDGLSAVDTAVRLLQRRDRVARFSTPEAIAAAAERAAGAHPEQHAAATTARIAAELHARGEAITTLAELGQRVTDASAQVVRELDGLITSIETRALPPSDDDALWAAAAYARDRGIDPESPEWDNATTAYLVGAFWMRGVGSLDEGAKRKPPARPGGDALLPSEALFEFAAWLTTRDEPITMGANHHAGPAAEAVSEFCERHGLQPPREDWPRPVVTPEFEPATEDTTVEPGPGVDHFGEAQLADASEESIRDNCWLASLTEDTAVFYTRVDTGTGVGRITHSRPMPLEPDTPGAVGAARRLFAKMVAKDIRSGAI